LAALSSCAGSYMLRPGGGRGRTLVPQQERDRLLRLLVLLKSASMRRGASKMRVTEGEINKLKPDIEFLESVLARDRAKADSA
jgi:hypothetical protein